MSAGSLRPQFGEEAKFSILKLTLMALLILKLTLMALFTLLTNTLPNCEIGVSCNPRAAGRQARCNPLSGEARKPRTRW